LRRWHSHGACKHNFRATGITPYLANGSSLENAQAMAAHESPRTTKLFDCTDDRVTLDEVQKIEFRSYSGLSKVINYKEGSSQTSEMPNWYWV
jgi:hypothetical protein